MANNVHALSPVPIGWKPITTIALLISGESVTPVTIRKDTDIGCFALVLIESNFEQMV